MAPELSSILMTAKEILQSAGRKGLHVQDIAEAAVARNKNMGLPVDVFYKKLQAALLSNLKLKATKPTFAPVLWDKGSRKGKPKQGWYRLKAERITPVAETVAAPPGLPLFSRQSRRVCRHERASLLGIQRFHNGGGRRH